MSETNAPSIDFFYIVMHLGLGKYRGVFQSMEQSAPASLPESQRRHTGLLLQFI